MLAISCTTSINNNHYYGIITQTESSIVTVLWARWLAVYYCRHNGDSCG